MISFKSGQLSKKEKQLIDELLCNFIDIYRDAYITKNNLRLFLKENSYLLYECLKQGDKIVYGEEEGIIFITGWSDSAERKYIKILADNENKADKLVKVLNWNLSDVCLYAKLKKENPLIKTLKQNGFKFLGSRGKEILLCRESKKNNFEEGAK